MQTAVIIQARIKSTRLPRKILLPLKGGNIIQHCMRNLKKVDVNKHILLCDYHSFKELEPFAEQEGYTMFCGPEEDVLKRFALAVKYFEIKTLIRGNGDNPLVSAEIANKSIERYKKTKADYFRFEKEPKGSSVEVINGAFISLANEISDDPYDREHVARKLAQNYFFSTIKYVEEEVPEKWKSPDFHITIDTQEHYDLVKNIYDDLYNDNPIKIEEAIKWFHENNNNKKTK